MSSDSDSEEFLGFTDSDIEGINNTEEGDSDDESDISVSTVNTADLSDFSLSESEDDEPEQVVNTWGYGREAVTVRQFESRSGPVSGVAEDGTAQDFFHLLFDTAREEAVESHPILLPVPL
jgi:hypothetical protein